MAAFAAAFFQVIYLLSPFSVGYTPWIGAIGLPLISLAPWFYTSRGWVWWPCYAILVFVTYRMGENVASGWSNYLAGNGGSFPAWSTEVKFMMVYGIFAAVFLMAQIIVLPFYRNKSVQLMRTDNPLAA
jgi:hypothetical protein